MKRLAVPIINMLRKSAEFTAKQEIRKNKQIFRSLLFSYCILMAIPVIIGIVNYSYMSDVLYEEAVAKEQLVLQNGMDRLELSIKNIDQTMNQLSMDSRIQAILNLNQPRSSSAISTLRSISQNLPVSFDDYKLISSYYIYCRRSGLMIGANQVFFDVASFYDSHFRVDGYEMVEWSAEILNQRHFRRLMPAKTVMYNGKEASCLLYLQEIYGGMPDDESGLIISYIAESVIHSILEQATDAKANFACLVDRNDRLLTGLSFGDVEIENLPLTGGKYTVEKQIDGETYVVNAMRSDDYGFSYVLGVKKADVLDNATPILWNMLFHMAILLGLGMLFAIVLGYININPLIHLMQKIMPENEQSNMYVSYRQLDDALVDLIANSNDLKIRMDEQSVLLREIIFSQIMNGEIADEEEMRSLLKCVQIDLMGEIFRGVLIYMDAADEDVKENVISCLKSRTHLPICCSAGMVSMIYADEEGDDDRVTAYFAALAEEMEKTHSVCMTFYVGGAGPLNGIHHSFSAARRLANYRSDKTAPVLVHVDNKSSEQKSYNYSHADERRIAYMVEQGDFVGIQQLLDDIYERHFVNTSLPTVVLQGLIMRLFETLQQIPGADEADVMSLEKCLSSSSRYVFDRMLASYRKLCEASLSRKQIKSSKLAEDIHNYIRENYCRYDLSLQEVMDHFDISLSYGSRLIKNQLGHTFSTILLQLRIEKANELLANSELPIQKISEMVGYDNLNSFRRAYKRTMGINPSEYRGNKNLDDTIL